MFLKLLGPWEDGPSIARYIKYSGDSLHLQGLSSPFTLPIFLKIIFLQPAMWHLFDD